LTVEYARLEIGRQTRMLDRSIASGPPSSARERAPKKAGRDRASNAMGIVRTACRPEPPTRLAADDRQLFFVGR